MEFLRLLFGYSPLLFAVLATLVWLWLACIIVAGLLLPFVLIRFYRALGHFNRVHESDIPPHAISERKEPSV